jgi:hypothetical protein
MGILSGEIINLLSSVYKNFAVEINVDFNKLGATITKVVR